MARPPKSSQSNTCNFLLAFLALWSCVSLVVIIVWATWPHMRNHNQSLCEAAKQTAIEKLEGVKVIWNKDQWALTEQLKGSREKQALLESELETVMQRVGEANVALMGSLQEKEIMKDNITALKIVLETHVAQQKNLSSVQASQKAHTDSLQANLTWSLHHWDSCNALVSAAKSQQVAAESQNKACNSANAYLTKRLNSCSNTIMDNRPIELPSVEDIGLFHPDLAAD